MADKQVKKIDTEKSLQRAFEKKIDDVLNDAGFPQNGHSLSSSFTTSTNLLRLARAH